MAEEIRFGKRARGLEIPLAHLWRFGALAHPLLTADSEEFTMAKTRKTKTAQKRPQRFKSTKGTYVISYRHDDGCPTIRSQSMADCVCDPVVVLRDAQDHLADLKAGVLS